MAEAPGGGEGGNGIARRLRGGRVQCIHIATAVLSEATAFS